jgi:hypothetical protein
MKFFLSLCAASLTLAACSTGIQVKKYNPGEASRHDFKQCRGFGCTYLHETKFTEAEWKRVVAVFKTKPAKTAEQERSKIAAAIAMMERIIGVKTGASADVGQATMTNKTPHQLDCIDETTNTTHYLSFLEDDGLLKFHRLGNPVHRGYFINGWPHNTATVRELETNAQYVIDSYYRDNGVKPDILPVKTWLSGWKPPKEELAR